MFCIPMLPFNVIRRIGYKNRSGMTWVIRISATRAKPNAHDQHASMSDCKLDVRGPGTTT